MKWKGDAKIGFFVTEIHGNIYLVVVKIVVGQHLVKPEHLVRFLF